ncbi:sensor histidine kinase [Vagococcus silagei]|uniref:histidine kinase n=1 Tax=Vagococcus silagei TaxID=2508885 RepID=A0A4S3B3B9_9ENTE|nr:histidine kinase [Vagococcus silagei]THB60737.1 sensor histidine kinase [Vagococcus silagei]
MKQRLIILGEFSLFLLIGYALLQQQFSEMINILYPLVSILFLSFILVSTKATYVMLVCFSGIILYDQHFAYFLPALLFFSFAFQTLAYRQLVLIMSGILFMWLDFSLVDTALLIGLSVLGFLLAHYQNLAEKLSERYANLVDDSWEREEKLEVAQDKLLTEQDAMLQIKIAEERNRIARDIHDHVGHLLSSALLQLGAIQAINQDEQQSDRLNKLSDTLNQGMDNIRWSVHNLHQESLVFIEGVHLMTADMAPFDCQIKGEVFKNLSEEQSRALLNTIKEALTNVKKHSNGSKVILTFTELPAFYRVNITDDGTRRAVNESGMGLMSMRQRIEKINGQFYVNISPESFSLQVILPKDKGGDCDEHYGS